MPLPTVRRAQPLSPNTLLRWDVDLLLVVPLTIDLMNIRAATAACVFRCVSDKPVFVAANSVRIAPAFRSTSFVSLLIPHSWDSCGNSAG